MKDKSLTPVGMFSLAGNDSRALLAIQIAGAVLNRTPDSLLKIIDRHKDDDPVLFCAVSGILYLIAEGEQDLQKILPSEYGLRKEYEKLASLLAVFKAILEKNNYSDYAIAILPSDRGPTKQDFWTVVLSGLLWKISESIFKEVTKKEDAYHRAHIMDTILHFAHGYQLVNADVFFTVNVNKVFCGMLDEMYLTSFSNSINKIWDANRAAREYFLRKLVLFNPVIPLHTREVVGKRSEAWFLLEDQYKAGQRPVKKSKLLQEVEALLRVSH